MRITKPNDDTQSVINFQTFTFASEIFISSLKLLFHP